MEREKLITEGEAALRACCATFASAPRAGALFCDIDGTISPIVAHPDEAAVPEPFRTVLAALTERLGLVAFVTGRTLEDGRRMISLDGAAYVGTHGLESMAPGGQIVTEPLAERYIAAVQEVAAAAARDLDGDALGVVLENKRTMLAVHYRLAADAARTRHEILTKVVEPARSRGLAISTGHFVFEVRPPLPFNKGTATRRLLAGGDYRAGMVCGDDLTDVTGFKMLHDWATRDARRTACAVAALTAETPRPVIEDADVLVRATPGVYEVLARLLAAVGG